MRALSQWPPMAYPIMLYYRNTDYNDNNVCAGAMCECADARHGYLWCGLYTFDKCDGALNIIITIHLPITQRPITGGLMELGCAVE